jgi:hypothetical protein
MVAALYAVWNSRDNQHFDESFSFAKLLGRELVAKGLRFSAHHAEPIAGENREIIYAATGVYRYDQLFVLKFSAAPTVLLEAGIIVNRSDDLMLSSPEHRDQISDAARVALNAFCASRHPSHGGTWSPASANPKGFVNHLLIRFRLRPRTEAIMSFKDEAVKKYVVPQGTPHFSRSRAIKDTPATVLTVR